MALPCVPALPRPTGAQVPIFLSGQMRTPNAGDRQHLPRPRPAQLKIQPSADAAPITAGHERPSLPIIMPVRPSLVASLPGLVKEGLYVIFSSASEFCPVRTT